jgi:hypothetical protein
MWENGDTDRTDELRRGREGGQPRGGRGRTAGGVEGGRRRPNAGVKES